MMKFWEFASSWELTSSSCPDLSRSSSSFLTDCAVPSRRGSWWGQTCCNTLQEASSGCPDRSCVVRSPLLRRPSTVIIQFWIIRWSRTIKFPWSIFLQQQNSNDLVFPSYLFTGLTEVELCETAVCFLHIQLIGTNVWLPKMHNVPPEVDFESSRSPAKSVSWNSPSLHCLAVLPTWQYCLYSHVWWIYEINRFRRLSQALVPFRIDRASLFTDHRISGLPIRAKYKHLRNNLGAILVTILQQISFLLLWSCGHRCME